MSSITINASKLCYVKGSSSDSWNSAGAYQGQYTGSKPRVGVLQFGDLLSVDWTGQVISSVKMQLSFAKAGANRSKTISLYRGAKTIIDGTGQSLLGAFIGDFDTVDNAYNQTLTIDFDTANNPGVFEGIVAWMQSMTTNTLAIYRDEKAGSSWSENYLQITEARLIIEYEPAGSGGTLNETEVDVGETVILSIQPIEAEGTVTHSVEWTFGSHSSGITNLGLSLSASFAYPIDWIDAIPDADKGTAYCRLTTYISGEFKAVRAIPFTLRVPASIIPDFDVLIEPVGTEDAYWQHLSSAKISILNATSRYGATIRSYSITGPDGFSSVQSVAETPVFASYGYRTYTVTVTDSRGRSAQLQPAVYVNPLAEPNIDAFSVKRYAAKIDDFGNTVYAENLSGGHVWFTIDAAVDTAGGNNAANAYIMYGPAGSELKNRIDIAWPANQSSVEVVNDRSILTADIPLNSAFEFRLYVADRVHQTSWPGRVEKSSATMHFAGTGHGVTVGGFSSGSIEDKRFDVAPEWKSHFPGGVYGHEDYRLDRVEKTEILEITGEKFDSYSAARQPKIYRVGPMVFMDGYAKNVTDLPEEFDELITTLPEWAHPAQRVSILQQGTKLACWWCIIYETGTVRASRYRSGSSYSSADVGSQFPLSACWLAKSAFVQTFSVSRSLTAVTISNNAQNVKEGSAYVARLTPDNGKKLTFVSVFMGGADVSGYYENGTIHIPIVTGNIEIVAVAGQIEGVPIFISDDGNGNVAITEMIEGSFVYEYDAVDDHVNIVKFADASVSSDSNGNVILT